MDIDDDCMETNYMTTLQKFCRHAKKGHRQYVEGESYKVRNQRYGQKCGQEEGTWPDSHEKKEVFPRVFPQNAGGVFVSILPPEKLRDHDQNLQITRLSRRPGSSEESIEQSQIQVRCPV